MGAMLSRLLSAYTLVIRWLHALGIRLRRRAGAEGEEGVGAASEAMAPDLTNDLGCETIQYDLKKT